MSTNAARSRPNSPMSAAPQVSVALCVFNGERYLREQLDSVLAQTGVRLEVFAVDDGSTDTSVALLRDYASRDPRVVVFVNAWNLGPRRCFERAMALGCSEFVAPCDQDDIWKTDKLARLLATIGTRDLAYGDSEFVDAAGVATGARVSDRMAMLCGHAPLRFVFANSVSGHAALVRRSLFDASRPFPAGVFHDWWLAMSAAMHGGIAYLDEPLVQFRRHDAAFSTLGRVASATVPNRNRLWLEDRRRLLQVYSEAAAPCPAGIAELRRALDEALAGGGRASLLRALWRLRGGIVAADESAFLQVIRLQLRFMRKLSRAQGEPRAPTPRPL